MNLVDEIEQLRSKLGLPSAPLVLAGLRTVHTFFTLRLRISPMAWVDYLKGIDFHHPVSEVVLSAPQEIVRHKPNPERPKPFMYFGQVGTSPMRTGTNFPSATFERFGFKRRVAALKSTASSISFGPSDHVVRPGGAVQYIIASTDFTALDPK